MRTARTSSGRIAGPFRETSIPTTACFSLYRATLSARKPNTVIGTLTCWTKCAATTGFGAKRKYDHAPIATAREMSFRPQLLRSRSNTGDLTPPETRTGRRALRPAAAGGTTAREQDGAQARFVVEFPREFSLTSHRDCAALL